MNQLPETLPSWEFELGIFLNNKYSKPVNMDPKHIPNRYLYTLQLSYLNDEERGNRMISIINNNKSIVTCVPNSTHIINRLESFTTKRLNYYKDDDEPIKKVDEKSKEEEIVKKDVDVDGDIEMENENENEVKKQIDIVSEEKDLEKENIEIDDDLIMSRYEENSLDEMKRRKKLLKHIQNGCCNNLNAQTNENLELMLVSKLQSLWTLKQTIRGQGGLGYIINVELNDEEKKVKSQEKFRLRTSNCLLHGTFKGFLIEIEHLDQDMEKLEITNELKNMDETESKNRLILRFSRSITMIKSLIDTYKFPSGNLCFNVLSESKLDYLSDLCQQYCDALQF
ncbi:mediator of RNA polymerase II transcription subunit [Pichia californica]|nr:mediator of RNA polymerase II transcription subunit [[Candida] californica]